MFAQGSVLSDKIIHSNETILLVGRAVNMQFPFFTFFKQLSSILKNITAIKPQPTDQMHQSSRMVHCGGVLTLHFLIWSIFDCYLTCFILSLYSKKVQNATGHCQSNMDRFIIVKSYDQLRYTIPLFLKPKKSTFCVLVEVLWPFKVFACY